MTYTFYEESVDWGAPIECYRFSSRSGTYRYTSHDTPVTILTETFAPVAMARDAMRVVSDHDTNVSLEINIDSSVPLIRDYVYSHVPPDNISVEILRVHDGSDFNTEHVKIWSGFISNIDVTGEMAKISVPGSFTRAMQSECPNVSYQNPCNHVLYDEKCQVPRGPRTVSATVEQFTGSLIRVDTVLSGVNAFACGEVECTRTQEKRSVHSSQDNALIVVYPFSDLRVGDNVNVLQGCDHSFETCKTKFSNQVNFGGFPSIPVDNPFEGEIG